MYTCKALRHFAFAAVISCIGTSAFAQVKPAVDGIFATVNLSYIAQSSKAGKAALARLKEAGKRKEAEAATKAADLRKQQVALQEPGSVLSERARADLQKAFERSRVDFDRFRQDAQAELQGLQAEFEAEFRLKLAPIVDQISKEKGFHFVFGLEQSTMIVWANPRLDISDEVVKRLDAAPERH
jgi:outer membrane protein